MFYIADILTFISNVSHYIIVHNLHIKMNRCLWANDDGMHNSIIFIKAFTIITKRFGETLHSNVQQCDHIVIVNLFYFL